MKVKIIFAGALSVLASCNSMPTLPDDGPKDMAKLADIIECEILNTFKNDVKDKKMFKDWAASYTITQNSTTTDGINLDPIHWIAPAGVDKLVYDGGGGVSREAYRWGKAEYTTLVYNKKSEACDRKKKYKDIVVSPSDFKLRDWVNQIANGNNQLKSLGYTVRITVTSNEGIGTDFADKKWTATDGVTHKRVSVRTVDFNFLQSAKPEPTKVIVVAPIPTGETKKDQGSQLSGNPNGTVNIPNKPIVIVPGKEPPQPKAPTSTQVPDSTVQQLRGLQQLQLLDRQDSSLSNQ